MEQKRNCGSRAGINLEFSSCAGQRRQTTLCTVGMLLLGTPLNIYTGDMHYRNTDWEHCLLCTTENTGDRAVTMGALVKITGNAAFTGKLVSLTVNK